MYNRILIDSIVVSVKRPRRVHPENIRLIQGIIDRKVENERYLNYCTFLKILVSRF